VAPWLWFLTRSVDCRIYQDLTIPEILRSVFDDHGVSHYELRLRSQYPKLVFCVQYRESAFAFVSRLMEHVGIFYWFEHHQDRHVLVLADANNRAPFTQPQQAILSVRPDLGEIQELEHDYAFHTGNWALNDFDFEVPSKNLRTHEPTQVDVEPMKRFETYDYPGSYTARDHGAGLTRLRMEEEEARHHRILGSGSCVGFDAGKRFTLTSDETTGGEEPATYLLTELRHSGREPGYFSTSGEPATYGNRFVAIPAETPFRPERLTPKPFVHGPQTATVVGPAGENIHTDQYGRVRLLFHWDRHGKRDEHASCWIRVSQHAAGSHWGALAIPHVGQEVIVGFLEGDPDRPIVTGHVHNGANMPPLNLPRDKDKTILRDHGDNKLIMHGKAGAQWLSLVSPRAVNFVAMRAPAKPLSADVVLDQVGFDQSQDTTAFQELEYVYNELAGQLGQATVPGGQAPGAGKDVPDEGHHGQSTAFQYDINSLSEGAISSLSLGNTNTWVGHDMNTWVKNNVHNHICNWQFDFYPYHQEFTPLLHTEETPGMHVEGTGIHIEDSVLHTEFHTGLHAEFHFGWHLDENHAQEINLKLQKVETTDDKIETINTEINAINESLSTYVSKTELVATKMLISAQMLSMQINSNIVFIGTNINLLGNALINLNAPTIIATSPVITLG
jgi:type VI secretion system VgrG family protein